MGENGEAVRLANLLITEFWDNDDGGFYFTANDHEELIVRKKDYFDNATPSGNSVAADRARMVGIPYATRDIFLDHEETASFVAGALAHAERLAKSRGVAIAIGHPKDVTIEGLRAWIPTLKDKGLELVPVSAILMQPSAVAAVQGTPALQDQPSAAITPAASVSAAPAPQPAPQP